MVIDESIRQSAEGMNAYGPKHDDWQIACSGGKDSSALVTLLVHLVKSGMVKPPKRCFITVVDTLQEIPALIENASALTDLAFRELGWVPVSIRPDLKNSFLFHLLGRGLFTPGYNGRNRWCTRVLKQEPMNKGSWISENNVKDHLLLHGSRVDESVARAKKMVSACSMAGSECGAGLYMTNEGAKYAPLTNWKNCTIWDWLQMSKNLVGYDWTLLFDLYANASVDDVTDDCNLTPEQISEIIDSTTRTGCIGCPVVGHDYALDRVCRLEKWSHLRPFLGLRDLYVSLRDHSVRLRKLPGEISSSGRVGPICIPARQKALDAILDMQKQSDEIADAKGCPRFVLIPDELAAMIQDAIDCRIFPQGWTGDEPLAIDTRPVSVQVFESFQ